MNSFLDKITDLTAQFLGSWWAVILHTIFFSIWLIFKLDIGTLTLYVSLEAIFIGIFLLMAANRAESQRERLHSREQARVETNLKDDVSLDKKQAEKLDRIISKLNRLEKNVGP